MVLISHGWFDVNVDRGGRQPVVGQTEPAQGWWRRQDAWQGRTAARGPDGGVPRDLGRGAEACGGAGVGRRRREGLAVASSRGAGVGGRGARVGRGRRRRRCCGGLGPGGGDGAGRGRGRVGEGSGTRNDVRDHAWFSSDVSYKTYEPRWSFRLYVLLGVFGWRDGREWSGMIPGLSCLVME